MIQEKDLAKEIVLLIFSNQRSSVQHTAMLLPFESAKQRYIHFRKAKVHADISHPDHFRESYVCALLEESGKENTDTQEHAIQNPVG